jgi:hypothetical protein
VPLLFAWGVDPRPLLFLIGLPLVPLFAWGMRRCAPRRARWVAAIVACLAVYLGVFWLVFYGPFVGVVRSMTFPMTWRMGGRGFQGSKQGHVILSFRDYPGYHGGLFSDDVAHYLQGFGSRMVDVTFEVTTDWGRTRGYREVRIGDLTSWRAEGGYSGVEYSGGRSPGRSPFP